MADQTDLEHQLAAAERELQSKIAAREEALKLVRRRWWRLIEDAQMRVFALQRAVRK